MNRRDFLLALPALAVIARAGARARPTTTLHLKDGSRVDFVHYGEVKESESLVRGGWEAQLEKAQREVYQDHERIWASIMLGCPGPIRTTRRTRP